MLPYAVIASYHGYVRTDGWLIIRLKKSPVIFFSNIGSQCRFVIKTGHIFTIPFRGYKFIPLPKCKNLGFYEN